MKQRMPKISLAVLVFIVTLAILVLLNTFDIFNPVRFLFGPIEQFSRNTTYIQNEWQCTQELNYALYQISNLALLEEENANLRQMLNFQHELDNEYIITNVISYDPQSTSLLYIDKGSDHNIRDGQPVIVGEGIIIGKILSTGRKTSLVRLLTSGVSKLAVRTTNTDKSTGLLTGFLGSAMQIEFIVDSQLINIGDLIITSGLEPLIPTGLVIGKVQEIFTDPSQLFTSAKVESHIDLSALRTLSVIRSI